MYAVTINIHKNVLFNIENEERVLVIMLDKNLDDPNYFSFILNPTYYDVLNVKDVYIRYHLLHALENRLPFSIAYIKNIDEGLNNLISFIIDDNTEKEYLFKYVPIVIKKLNDEDYAKFVNIVAKLFDENLGCIIYGYKKEFNHRLHFYVPDVLSVVDNENYYHTLYVAIQLALNRKKNKYSIPHNSELLGYLYGVINTYNLSGFYDINNFQNLYDYEFVLSAIVTLKYLIYRSILAFKHKFDEYVSDIRDVINNILHTYIGPISSEYTQNLYFVEEQNLLNINIIVKFKKPNLVVNIDIHAPINVT